MKKNNKNNFILKNKINQEFDDDNRLIINMEIKNDDHFLDEFSRNDYPIINSAIDEYIQKYIMSINIRQDLKLVIHSDCIDEEEKEIYTRAIKDFYLDKFYTNKHLIRQNYIIATCLGLFGALILSIVIILEYSGKSEFWMRIFDIVSWVFIWETVDIFAFKCKELKFTQKRNLKLINMPIEYV